MRGMGLTWEEQDKGDKDLYIFMKLCFSNEERSFGAAGIDCTGSEYHILRCQIFSPKISEGQCNTYIKVECKQGILFSLINHPFF